VHVCGITVTLLKEHPTRYHHHHYCVTYPPNKIASPLCAALEYVAQPIAMDVDQALSGMSFPSGSGFSNAQYKAVACMLLDSPHHAVDWKELAVVVGAVDGASNPILTFYRHFLQGKLTLVLLAIRVQSTKHTKQQSTKILKFSPAIY